MSHLDTTLDRILAVRWAYDASRRKSHEALFKEYLRRQALWLEQLDLLDYFPTYDLAVLVDKNVRASMETASAVRHHLSMCTLNSSMIISGVMESALHWAVLEDTGLVSTNGLPNPYEPMLVLFERGGTFTVEEMFGRFVIANSDRGPSLPRGPWRRWHQATPFVLMESMTLDALDGR